MKFWRGIRKVKKNGKKSGTAVMKLLTTTHTAAGSAHIHYGRKKLH